MMTHDSPPDSWYEPLDDDDDHACRGVWCLDARHAED